jgi:DNA-binding transcriptional LysR family regulator
MRLRQIEIFYHVYRTGSISGAARELNVSQPSVSKVLRHAEDQLGFDLFQRKKGRLIPTVAADELFHEVEDLYGRLASFNRTLDNMRERKDGHLRIGVLPALSLSAGPELAAKLCDDDHRLSVEFTTLHSNEITTSLMEKRNDLCIGFAASDNDEIASRRVGSGNFVLVSNRKLSADRDRVELSSIDGAKFIGLKDSRPLASVINNALDDSVIKPNEVITTDTYHVALSLVRKGAGLAITDQFTAYSHLGSGLHRYPLRDLPKFSVHAMRRGDHPDEKLLDKAINGLERVLTELSRGITAIQKSTV